MTKTKFERIDVAAADTAAFRISGKLGFHENTKVQRLTEECLKREFRRVIFDFSELSSLGGGVAKILRTFTDTFAERGGSIAFVVTNDIVSQFLQDGERTLSLFRTIDEALAAPAAEKGTGALEPSGAGPADGGVERTAEASPAAPPAAAPGKAADIICMPYDGGEALDSGSTAAAGADGTAPSPPDGESDEAAEGSDAAESAAEGSEGEAEEIITEIFGGALSGETPRGDERESGPGQAAAEGAAEQQPGAVTDLNRQLKRRILELKTLFSISTDFNAIRDRKKLMDIFLLTSIAQGGVESAVFFESFGGAFKPVMSKGLDHATIEGLELPLAAQGAATGESNVIPIDLFALDSGKKQSLRRQGLEYICPFRHKDTLAGFVLLGRRIAGRGMKEEDFEFLRILINLAQNAYDNALMFEHEHERTLGIVKTLISLIEDNTLLKGTSEFVSRYVGMVAKNMDYSEESFKELIYGTVLRDMGMIKVSDLILRSPRDLTKEEWEVIKRHPEDGAEMLTRMKFSDHVINIVRTHHERFNGEGYPYGIRGKEIPLGSRIISVVESYAAMIHERPNRPALSGREALDTLKENYGLRYDREVIGQFARIMEREFAQSVSQETAVG